MNKPSQLPSLQDFSVVSNHVKEFTSDYNLSGDSLGFMFFVLDLVLGLQDDEIEDAITDTSYLRHTNKESGHDRGLDAVYIDYSEKPAVVHLFNMKYTDELKKTARNFPSSEIDKILGRVKLI